jgi:hypothetical protein
MRKEVADFLHKHPPAEPVAPEFPWLTHPCDPVYMKSEGDMRKAANEYFTTCAELGIKPRLNGLALVLGVTGPTSLQRLAQRRPAFRWMISRCLTAIAYGYEEDIEKGSSAGNIFMLKHLPEFDVQDPAGSKPVQYFTDKRELVINAHVSGVKYPDQEGAELTPREAYLKVIHGHNDDMDDIVEGVFEDVVEEGHSLELAPDLDRLEQILNALPPSKPIQEHDSSDD